MRSRKVIFLSACSLTLALFLIPFVSHVSETRSIHDWLAWTLVHRELTKNWIRLNLLIQPQGALISLETQLAHDPSSTLHKNAQREMTNCLERLGAKADPLSACKSEYLRLGETKKIHDNYALKQKNYISIALAWRRAKKTLYDACDQLKTVGQDFFVSGENAQTRQELEEIYTRVKKTEPLIDTRICTALKDFNLDCPDLSQNSAAIDPPACEP